ncbi:hypothetical protein AB0J40_09300 [Amycolatopsis sp. NPDC049691]|uniref:hypothetical protein n=1 Tax=Amycolatopsis sp. NPDC049691 TaxID=3155155 RepID=UPI00342754F5
MTTGREFVAVLRGRVTATVDALASAREAGLGHEVELHLGRLRDLLELAERHDVDVAGWVDPAVLAAEPYRD